MYLAKSYPEESIQTHTDNLIKNYNILMDIYGDRFDNLIRQALKDVCLYHDLGKINQVFQNKIKRIQNINVKKEIPHGYLSVGFFKINKMKEIYGTDLIRIIVTAVAKHHDREFKFSENKAYIREEIIKLKERVQCFQYKELPNIHEDINTYPINLIYEDGLASISEEKDKIDYIILKGLLNRIDFSASGYYQVEYKNDFLIESLDRHKMNWGKDADYNELQKYMINHQNKNVIAIAETGYGKTEAGLLWIGNNKGFFTLPLRSAINSIFDRVRNDILNQKSLDERLALLHSDSLNELFNRSRPEEGHLTFKDLEIIKYNDRARQKSLPLTISTIDQIFKFVYKYEGFEQELAILSYSKIVIDEIQMYSPDLLAYLIIGLDMLTKVGGKFSIITATLPPFILDLIRNRGLNFIMPEKPYYKKNRIRHCMELKEEEINSQFIYEKYKNNKVLVIVNTVRKAQELYEDIADTIDENELRVFHGGFIKSDRKAIEKDIVSFGRTSNKRSGIWICTQVAEASLDIDFDILITELSDINGLFQRMGRCYRNRSLGNQTVNIFVFDGGLENCSGIGFVNDKDIFNMSKNVLREKFKDKKARRISEMEKINIIDEIYTTENLKNTKYYKDIIGTLSYVDSMFFYELNKYEVIKRFRSINNIDVIPKKIYDTNKIKIGNCIKVLQKKYNIEDRENQRIRKAKARIDIADFTATIPFYFSNSTNTEIIQISEYESINIYNCDYDCKFGIKHRKDTVKKEYKDYTNNII